MRNTSLHPLAALLIVAVALMGCQDNVVSPAPDMESDAATSQAVETANNDCIETDAGLTAKVVNEDVIGETIDVGECDVGAFFDEEGEVRNATFTQPADDPGLSEQHAVYVEGAEVQVTDSEVDVTEDYRHQFIAIGYHDGATGIVEQNTVTGFHRVGILLDGEDTSAEVRHNDVTGVGPKTDGWAENGIQVSSGATGTVVENTVENHWWDMNNFVSSGIIIFLSDDVVVQRNTLEGNDAAVILQGDRNNVIHNTVDVTADDESPEGIFHAGAIVFEGEENGLRQNTFTSGSPDGSLSFGIYVDSASDNTSAGVNTKLIRNTFDGFTTEIVDEGDETKLPSPFDPAE